jgi:hypothetical protein
MTHKLTQSSTATTNTTAPDSEAPDVSMDFDAIRSRNNIRDRKNDEADRHSASSIMDKSASNDRRDTRSRSDYDDEAFEETHTLGQYIRGKGYIRHIFAINHREDTATVTTVRFNSEDVEVELSIESARKFYKTLLSYGFRKN